MRSELNNGLEMLTAKTRANGLTFASQRLNDRLATLFEFSNGKSRSRMVITDEFIADLPGTAEHQQHLDSYLRILTARMSCPNPRAFYCLSGIPVEIDIDWPIQAVPQRAASFVWVILRDLRSGFKSYYSAMMTHQLEIMDANFKLNPFLREELIVNSIRYSIDRGEVNFYPEDAIPREAPAIRVANNNKATLAPAQIENFLAGKTYWLAFKAVDRTAKIWINDPWDISYLSAQKGQLIQSAQALEADKILELSNREFACAGGELLRQRRQFEEWHMPTGTIKHG